ncbi:MAG: hypothetical protein ABI267_06210 [Ginsengibacter sp.]
MNTIKIFAFTLIVAVSVSSCGKDPVQSGNPIQQGNTIIQINAISAAVYNNLQVRYNNVIDAPINATIAFHLKNGQKKNIQITIPANNKRLQEWSNNNFINSWNYTGFYDSTGIAPAPSIDPSWDIASVEITAVSCPDKQYGFKVLTGADDWTFYTPKDLHTSVSFISNKDTISYSDYDFIANVSQYNNTRSNYYFNFFNNHMLIISHEEQYPLYTGMTINIPLMVYNRNPGNYGSQPDGPEAASNGSTIVLTITKVTDTHFDATFSGNLWSSRQADTLHISDGEIKNALLPERVD